VESVSGYKINIISDAYPNFLAHLAKADLILTPTRRLATRLNKDYAAYQATLGIKVWQLQIISLAGYLDVLWQNYQDNPTNPNLLCLSAWQNNTLWQNIIEANSQTPLLRKESAANLAMSAWKLLNEWQIDKHELQSETLSADMQVFMQWCTHYEKTCEEKACCDTSTIHRHIIAACPEKIPSQIYLVGFTDITPSIQALLNDFAKQGTIIEALEYREYKADVCCAPQKDPASELTQAALWAKSLLEKNLPYPIGIVVPDLAVRWEEVDAIFSSVLMPESILANHYDKPRPYNISAGRKLADFPIVSLVFELLKLNTQAISFGQLLLSPFITGFTREGMARSALDFSIQSLGIEKISLKKLQTLTSYDACAILQSLLENNPVPSTALLPPSAWTQQFKQTLTHWGWPGERILSSVEYQVVSRFYELLNDFALLDCVQPPISYYQACYLLRQQAQALLFQGESEDKPIEILGHLEAAGLYFQALWVTGLHNENWPQACAPHPFLPGKLQRDNAMPHASAEREYAFAANLTQRYTEQSKTVVLSYPQQDNDKKLLPSPLITSYPKSLLNFKNATASVVTQLETWEESNVPLGAKKQIGGAGLLQSQASCPFQAFARYRLNAKSLTPLERGLSYAQRGQLVHAALAAFWPQVQTSVQLHSLTASECAEKIKQACEMAIKQFGFESLPLAHIAIEKQRLFDLMNEWLSFEKTRTSFKVIAHEENIHIELPGISLRARIDRIDQAVSGEIWLIDYKTGRLNTPDWMELHPSHLQLPLYAMSYKNTAGIAYAQVKRNDAKLLGVNSDHESWDQMCSHWQERISKIADDFVSGDVRVAPLEGENTCAHCELALLCRIRSST
jgi:ATP-dependent helicase/nuclease subunit B